MSQSFFFFDGSPALCLDPLSFHLFFGIVFKSLFFSTALRHHVQILFFSTILWHHVQTLHLFGDSPALCPDTLYFQRLFGTMPRSSIFLVTLGHRARVPYLFRWLFDIVFGSPFVSVALWHCVWILYLFFFNGSSALCSDPLSFCRLSSIVLGSLIFLAAL